MTSWPATLFDSAPTQDLLAKIAAGLIVAIITAVSAVVYRYYGTVPRRRAIQLEDEIWADVSLQDQVRFVFYTLGSIERRLEKLYRRCDPIQWEFRLLLAAYYGGFGLAGAACFFAQLPVWPAALFIVVLTWLVGIALWLQNPERTVLYLVFWPLSPITAAFVSKPKNVPVKMLRALDAALAHLLYAIPSSCSVKLVLSRKEHHLKHLRSVLEYVEQIAIDPRIDVDSIIRQLRQIIALMERRWPESCDILFVSEIDELRQVTVQSVQIAGEIEE